ncbi:hypothetical protein [Labrys monachus]|uniref:Peptidoglycan binding-like domain-containing protein n=1 Tax=Labrys monachus TaxID=217067 RepID=A0ABU0FM13_9HYPH|nr:hypothetical protein [Labrys monachus]MDQ0395649.1 hypothetical protein [Labrys monachus]
MLSLSAFALPAIAQTKSPAATKTPAATAPAADPAFEAAKAAAAAEGPDALSAVQMDLIWTGDLNSLPTGDLGKRSYEAIKAFQKRIKAKDTGILLPPERAVLAQHAAKFTDRYGFTEITDRGLTVGYPAKLASKRTEGKNGPNFASPKGDVSIDVLSLPADKEDFEALFARMKTERPGRKVTYSLLRPDFFVVTGVNDGKSFYLRFLRADGLSRGFALGWDPALSPAFDRVAIAMAASLRLAGPDEAAETAAKPAAKPVQKPAAPAEPAKPAGPPVPLPAGAPAGPRTGLGVLVSDKGDILTYAGAVAGCTSVTMADGSRAAVIGGDPANDIAVVRLARPARLAPLSWRTAPLAMGEAVSVLSGASPVAATVTALAGPGADTRRVGLSAGGGGALADKDGALVGLAAADGSPVALKALFVTAFLRANGAAPPAKGGDAARDMMSFRCEPGK